MPCDDCSRAETCPPCVNEDARLELFNELRQWMHSHTANELIDNFAHALAQKQRAWLIREGYGPSEETGDGDCPCGGCSWCLAQDFIDLIDPKTEA